MTDLPHLSPRRMLVVCTANLCRSPVAEALLARRLAEVVDIDGREWIVSSAGTGGYGGPADPDTAAAAATLGLEMKWRAPHQLTKADLDAADLVVTMSREHLQFIVVSDPSAWSRTFTLRELVRRTVHGVQPRSGFDEWLNEIGSGRTASDMLKPSRDDDVTDPYRQGRAANIAMVNQLDQLTKDLVTWGPWRQKDVEPTPRWLPAP
jgi:protein-tyrosine phosphatase